MIQIHPKVEQMGGVKWDPATSQAAARAAKIYQEQMNKGRRLPKMLGRVQALAEEQAIHLFNVGPFAETVYLGTWGDVRVPACPADKDWVYVCKIPGVYQETIPGEDKFDGEEIDGEYIAQEVLGEGPLLRNHRGDSRRKTGMFIGSVRGPNGATPKPEEVQAARDEVRQTLHNLVLEAKGSWGTGNEADFKANIGSKHYLAAQLMLADGLITDEEVPWFKARLAPKKAVTVECPACGTAKKESAVVCAQCGYKDPAHPNYEKLFGKPVPSESPEQAEARRLREENERLRGKK